jgi:hypothetical protein
MSSTSPSASTASQRYNLLPPIEMNALILTEAQAGNAE